MSKATVPTDILKLEVTKRMIQLLDRLLKAGLHGPTREAVAIRMMEDGLSDQFPWISSVKNLNRTGSHDSPTR